MPLFPLRIPSGSKTGESTLLMVMREDYIVYIQHLDSVKSVKVSGTVEDAIRYIAPLLKGPSCLRRSGSH